MSVAVRKTRLYCLSFSMPFVCVKKEEVGDDVAMHFIAIQNRVDWVGVCGRGQEAV